MKFSALYVTVFSDPRKNNSFLNEWFLNALQGWLPGWINTECRYLNIYGMVTTWTLTVWYECIGWFDHGVVITNLCKSKYLNIVNDRKKNGCGRFIMMWKNASDKMKAKQSSSKYAWLCCVKSKIYAVLEMQKIIQTGFLSVSKLYLLIHYLAMMCVEVLCVVY